MVGHRRAATRRGELTHRQHPDCTAGHLCAAGRPRGALAGLGDSPGGGDRAQHRRDGGGLCVGCAVAHRCDRGRPSSQPIARDDAASRHNGSRGACSRGRTAPDRQGRARVGDCRDQRARAGHHRRRAGRDRPPAGSPAHRSGAAIRAPAACRLRVPHAPDGSIRGGAAREPYRHQASCRRDRDVLDGHGNAGRRAFARRGVLVAQHARAGPFPDCRRGGDSGRHQHVRRDRRASSLERSGARLPRGPGPHRHGGRIAATRGRRRGVPRPRAGQALRQRRDAGLARGCAARLALRAASRTAVRGAAAMGGVGGIARCAPRSSGSPSARQAPGHGEPALAGASRGADAALPRRPPHRRRDRVSGRRLRRADARDGARSPGRAALGARGHRLPRRPGLSRRGPRAGRDELHGRARRDRDRQPVQRRCGLDDARLRPGASVERPRPSRCPLAARDGAAEPRRAFPLLSAAAARGARFRAELPRRENALARARRSSRVDHTAGRGRGRRQLCASPGAARCLLAGHPRVCGHFRRRAARRSAHAAGVDRPAARLSPARNERVEPRKCDQADGVGDRLRHRHRRRARSPGGGDPRDALPAHPCRRERRHWSGARALSRALDRARARFRERGIETKGGPAQLSRARSRLARCA